MSLTPFYLYEILFKLLRFCTDFVFQHVDNIVCTTRYREIASMGSICLMGRNILLKRKSTTSIKCRYF
ncbi:hypothetical protein XENTR_v10001767 [Xenopus tropicalis]|nr:hypothetical protein XENTR_v10001767 [Xenopus tropicalis]